MEQKIAAAEGSTTQTQSEVQLITATAGFWLYAIRQNGKCVTVAAPHVSGFSHKCELLIVGTIEDDGGLPLQPVSTGYVLVPTNCDIRFTDAASPSGAGLRDFDLIVDFDSICCGASLRPDWREGDPVDITVTLPDGTLQAFADEHTNKKQFRWRDCAGNEVARSLTSLTIYNKPDWQPAVLMFTRRSPNGTDGRIRFSGDRVILALKYGPEEENPRPHDVDLAHIAATLRLCEVPGEVRFTLGKEEEGRRYVPGPALPSEVLKFLDLALRLKGRPHCGARQMPG